MSIEDETLNEQQQTETPAESAPLDAEAEALAALDAGIEAVTEKPDEETPVEEVPAEAAAEEAPKAEATETEGEPEKLSAEDEATQLGLTKEKSRARFVELHGRVSELEGQLTAATQKAERYDEMLGHIEATGATPEQYSSVMGYLHAVNRGGPAELAQLRDALAKELEWLDGKIGRSGDVLAKHDDLREAVASGELPEAYAREIAQQRNMQALTQQYQQQVSQREQQAQQQYEAAAAQAVEELNQLGARLAAQDPQFDQKVEQAKANFIRCRDSVPPSAWAQEFLLAYQAVQLAPAKPRVGAVPLRPAGSGAGTLNKTASSPEEALEMGLQAYARGR
ncbi:hypothetical protein CO615_04065 [Lysobacteraceae bacterium NML75-0749]|nr:hypothetical protein CO615_04065 [Xanthomonadaceae bacterium NML75-0749]